LKRPFFVRHGDMKGDIITAPRCCDAFRRVEDSGFTFIIRLELRIRQRGIEIGRAIDFWKPR
jgi:hypothetical protein